MKARENAPEQLPVGTAATSAPATVHDNLVLTAKYLPIVAPFIAKSDPRYYLAGINIRPLAAGGVTIAGCNGHVLGVFHDPAGVCTTEVTLAISIELLTACAGGINTDRTVEMRAGRLTVLDKFGTEIYIQAGNPVINPDKPYPRFEKIIPAEKDISAGLMGCINAMLLTKLNTAAAAARKALDMRKCFRSHHGMTFFNSGADGDKKTIARLDFSPNFLAVVMPLRPESDISTPLPVWLQAERGAA